MDLQEKLKMHNDAHPQNYITLIEVGGYTSQCTSTVIILGIIVLHIFLLDFLTIILLI